MTKVKIQIKSWLSGSVLFEYESTDNDIRTTLIEAVKSGANLRGANLRDVPFDKLPADYINQCSRDMLFVFEHLKSELRYLREKLLAGEIDGTQYEGDCACLVGTLAKADNEHADDDDINKVCEHIPFYTKGIHNPAEQWFWQIRQDDTPDSNQFAAHALKLIDMVLNVAEAKAE